MGLFALQLRCLTTCLGLTLLGAPIFGMLRAAAAAESAESSVPSMKLQGRAEVQQDVRRDRNLEAWQASQAYRWGAMSLDVGNLPYAADWFKVAGDGFEASIGEGKFLADARFAEAHSRMMLRQGAKAAPLFEIAARLFRKYDPNSPFLKASLAALQRLPKPGPLQAKIEKFEPTKLNLIALPGQIDKVGRDVPLKSKISKFEDGTLLASLKDEQFFIGGKKRLLSQAAALDIGDDYVKKTIYKAFLKMTCLETTALTGNYETATRNYQALKASGRPVAVGAADDINTPVVTLLLNGKNYIVPMDLPGIDRTSRNVLLVTDGQDVLAIDPRTDDTWKLIATFYNQRGDFNWWKLTHTKKRFT